MRITEITAADVLADSPELQLFVPEESGDVFICANGFEDRTLAVAHELAHAQVRFDRSIMLTYSAGDDGNVARRPELEASLRHFSDRVEMLDGDTSETKFAATLTAALKAGSEPGRAVRVLYDISGCSGRFILRVMRVLFDFGNENDPLDLRIVYTQAQSYAPTKEEADAILRASVDNPLETRPSTLGLDWDAGEVAHLIERPGQHIDHAPDRAVVICGFNADRIRASLDRIDTGFNIDFPHPRVTYIAGLPAKPEDRWRLDAMVRINSSEDGTSPRPLVASTLDYRETLKILETIYEEAGGYQKLTVLPFGSKMQSLAVALFCEAHPDVRVQMLAPSRYRSVEYSTGVETIHELGLGLLHDLSHTLRRIGELEVVPEGRVPERAFTQDEGAL